MAIIDPKETALHQGFHARPRPAGGFDPVRVLTAGAIKVLREAENPFGTGKLDSKRLAPRLDDETENPDFDPQAVRDMVPHAALVLAVLTCSDDDLIDWMEDGAAAQLAVRRILALHTEADILNQTPLILEQISQVNEATIEDASDDDEPLGKTTARPEN